MTSLGTIEDRGGDDDPVRTLLLRFAVKSPWQAQLYTTTDASMLESCECAPGRKEVPVEAVLLEGGQRKSSKYYKLRVGAPLRLPRREASHR